mgnify:CR=1
MIILFTEVCILTNSISILGQQKSIQKSQSKKILMYKHRNTMIDMKNSSASMI